MSYEGSVVLANPV